MSEASRPKLSDVLYSDILSQIRKGDFRDQPRLPSEVELSQRFSVSRPIVREALGRLRHEGIIHSRRGAGSFVTESGSGSSQVELDSAPPPLQSIDDLQKFYDFRLAIEGEAAYRAAVNASARSRAQIKAELDALHVAVRTGQVGVNQDFAFHMAVATASENRFFVSSLLALRPHLDFLIDLARSFSLSVSEEHIKMVHQEHAVVLEAIEARDGDGARERMRVHIENARQRVFFGTRRPG
jgi:GntR family transcriptional regulator, transcriptional repressor for pyruvate dehydrogenase complex